LRIQVQEASAQIIHLPSAGHMKTIAETPNWFAWSVTPEPISAEKRVERADGNHIRIMIEATPQDEIAEAWSEARGFLLLMAALAAGICALVHITLGRAFASVGAILQGLGDMERGDYGRRLPHFSLPEFARIARALNHTAQTLAKARDENRALVQQSLVIQEEERHYLAQELHDELGQSLSAIKIMAAALRKPTEVGADAEAAGAIMEICDRLFGVVRAMMRRLRPTMLDELGLTASLEDLIENWRGRNPGVRLDFICESGVEECAGGAKIHLFRIVQEALTNVIKHADARNVGIHLRLGETDGKGNGWIDVTVSDDGKGFEPSRPSTGLGLSGMRERVASLGGSFSLETRPRKGVRIEVSVPCVASMP
jgi:two-component system sensor histidine kinase UhpB